MISCTCGSQHIWHGRRETHRGCRVQSRSVWENRRRCPSSMWPSFGYSIIGEHCCRHAGGLETVIGEYGNPHDMDGDVSSADLPRGGHDDAQSIETHRTARRDEKDRGTPTVELKAAGRDEWCSITSSRPVSCSALSRQLLPRGDLKSRTVGGKPLGSPATSFDFTEHIFDQLAWRG